MTTKQGNIIIRNQSEAEQYRDVEKVKGGLTIYPGIKLVAPNLKNVGGNLFISSEAKLTAPNLESVGGYLHISSKAKLIAPKLIKEATNDN